MKRYKRIMESDSLSSAEMNKINDYIEDMKSQLLLVPRREREREYDSIWMALRKEYDINDNDEKVRKALYAAEDKMINQIRNKR